MKIHVSLGNDKIGDTPNISLPPVATCHKDVPCFDLCYARKFYKWRSVRTAWDANYEIWKTNKAEYFKQIYDWLKRAEPKFFRWHVGGDCPTMEYMAYVFSTARSFPNTSFLMYTKQFEFIKILGVENIPCNLTIMLSMWPYLENPDIALPRMWVTGDLRCPSDAFKCQGVCEVCRRCWYGTKDVSIRLH